MTIGAGAIWWCRTVRESHKQLKWNHMRITLHNGSTRKVSISSVILSFLFRVSIVNRLDPDLSWAIIIVNFIICIVILAVLFCCRMSEEEGKKIAREKKKKWKNSLWAIAINGNKLHRIIKRVKPLSRELVLHYVHTTTTAIHPNPSHSLPDTSSTREKATRDERASDEKLDGERSQAHQLKSWISQWNIWINSINISKIIHNSHFICCLFSLSSVWAGNSNNGESSLGSESWKYFEFIVHFNFFFLSRAEVKKKSFSFLSSLSSASISSDDDHE